MDELDYRLDGFTPATVMDEADTEHLLLSSDMHHLLASHHSQDGRNTYLLAYDQTAIWDAPGTPAYLAINVQRDPAVETYTVDQHRQPLLPLAQNWLIRCGCPPTEINVNNGPEPSSSETVKIEARLRHDTEDRYTVLDHYTAEPIYPTRDGRTWALLYDHHPDAVTAPFKAVVEHTTADLDSYSVTEGAFPTRDTARDWLAHHDSPQPASQRAHAARSRSASAAVVEEGKAPPLPATDLPTNHLGRPHRARGR